METRNKIIALISLVFLALLGCTPKPIDIDIAPAEQKLVVTSQVIPSKVMIVGLTRSFSALASESKKDSLSSNFLDEVLVDNAVVTVSYLNNKDTLFKIAPGIYASLNVLLYDYGVYTLQVKDPKTGQEIIATSTMLPKVPFDTIQPKVNVNGKDTAISVWYEFTDIAGADNYYVVNYYVKTDSSKGANFDINSFFSRGSNKLLTEFDLISDKEFAGEKFAVEKKLNEVKLRDTLAVTISNISKGYYEFLTAYKKSGNLFNQLTGEPINYPTNVISGYGFFNTHYPDVRFFELWKYK